MFEDPYVIDWSMPQNSLAGEVVVRGLRMVEDQRNAMSTLTLGRHLREGNTSGGLGVIDTTESELSVGVVGRGRGSEEDGDEVLADNAMREEVVCDYRSTTRKYHSYAVQSSIPYQ